MCEDAQKEIRENCNGTIPTSENIECLSSTVLTEEEDKLFRDYMMGEIDKSYFKYLEESSDTETTETYQVIFKSGKSTTISVSRIILTWDNQKINENEYWLAAEAIHYLIKKYGTFITVVDGDKVKFLKADRIGYHACFCISTNTGSYKLNGLTSHNSVFIQNIIMHNLAHWNNTRMLLIDPKQVEFSDYAGHNGICGVANTVDEAYEGLKIAKNCMDLRYTELKNMGKKNANEYQPQKKTGNVFVTGATLSENDLVKVKIDGEEKEITAKELVDITHSK